MNPKYIFSILLLTWFVCSCDRTANNSNQSGNYSGLSNRVVVFGTNHIVVNKRGRKVDDLAFTWKLTEAQVIGVRGKWDTISGSDMAYCDYIMENGDTVSVCYGPDVPHYCVGAILTKKGKQGWIPLL